MRHFQITVNGIGYQVSVEEVNGVAAPVAAAPAPIAAPVAAPAPVAPVAAAPKAAAPVAGGTKVSAPMPGTILDVKVQAGQSVKKGDVLVILEAMKMENEICAPSDGKITGVNVRKGDSVETQALLCTIA